MNKIKLSAGLIGFLSVLIFGLASSVSVNFFTGGKYSLLYCFPTELGFNAQSMGAFIFNTALIVTGLLFCLFMILFAMEKGKSLYIAVCLSAVLSGMLLCAQGIFTLNYISHYYILIDFFASVFITCVIYIIAEMLFNKNKTRFFNSVIAFLTGVTGMVYAGFIFTNGIGRVFINDRAGTARDTFLPFAFIGWLSYIFFFLMLFIMAFEFLAEVRTEHEAMSFRLSPKDIEQDFLPSKKQSVRNTRNIEL